MTKPICLHYLGSSIVRGCYPVVGNGLWLEIFVGNSITIVWLLLSDTRFSALLLGSSLVWSCLFFTVGFAAEPSVCSLGSF